MGKVYNNRVCSVCGEQTKVLEVWGVYFCKICNDKRPKTGRKGHGGLVAVEDLNLTEFKDTSIGIVLEPIKKGHPVFATLFLEHYPQSKGIMGRTINYLVRLDGNVAGIIGANSPPLNYKKFREFFNTDDEKSFVNNNVFRLIHHEKNFGTKVLKLFRKTLTIDYNNKYGDKLKGIITFVEPPRTGAVYKADNWTFLGETQGKKVIKRDFSLWTNKEWMQGTKKLIYAKKL